MDNAAVEILALVLGLAGIFLLILANEIDCWRHDAKDQFSSVGLSVRCRGLWSECVFDNTANMWTCDSPLSFLGDLPVEMVVTRAVVVITCTVCILAIPGLICGMRCTKLISDIQNQKVKLILSSGILFLFGGVSGAVGLLWYGADTLIKYRQEVKFGIPGVTYELGFSYWLAAGAVACIVTSAVTLLTQHCMAQRKADFRSGPTVLPLSHWSHLKYPGHRTENGQTYI